MWWKRNKWKVIIPVLAAVLLAAAFWWGGNAPGLRGWQVSEADESLKKPENAAADVNPESAGPQKTVPDKKTEQPAEDREDVQLLRPEEDPAASNPAEKEPEKVPEPEKGAEETPDKEPNQEPGRTEEELPENDQE